MTKFNIINNVIILLGYILLSATISLCFENEPNNFRKINFGESTSGHPDLYLSDIDELGHKIEYDKNKPSPRVYRRKNEKRYIGKAKIGDIFYYFYQDRFYYARVNFNSVQSYNSLYQSVVGIHGEPNFSDDQGYTRWKEWRGKDINITLSFVQWMWDGRAIKKEGFIDYKYLPIDEEFGSDLKAYYKQKDKIEKASEKIYRKQQSEKAMKDLY